jgi:hypothetical protein
MAYDAYPFDAIPAGMDVKELRGWASLNLVRADT